MKTLERFFTTCSFNSIRGQPLTISGKKDDDERSTSFLRFRRRSGFDQAYWRCCSHRKNRYIIHIEAGKVVLDVGCGVGQTPCFLAKRYDCKCDWCGYYGSDVERSMERAKREKVLDRVEFRVADAQDLPFENNCLMRSSPNQLQHFLRINRKR